MRDLLLDNALEPNEYKQIKTDSERRIQSLEAMLFNTSSAANVDIDSILEKALSVLSKLDEEYFKADVKKKRKVVGSIFPEKIVFDGFNFRTIRLNEVARLIYKLDEGFSGNEKGENSVKTEFSYCVDPYGFEP